MEAIPVGFEVTEETSIDSDLIVVVAENTVY